jgi:outer membrane protein
MKQLSLAILHILLPVLAVSAVFLSVNAGAESIIRIIGDKSSVSPDSSAERPSARGGNTIRIVGDKPVRLQPPVSNDKAEAIQEKVPEKQVDNETIENGQKLKAQAENESLAKEATEQQLAKRLLDLKAESERKAAEKAEQERLAQLKEAQEIEDARKAEIEKEQERLAKENAAKEIAAAKVVQQEALKRAELASRNAEELRRNSERLEEERLAAARKALVEQLRLDTASASRHQDLSQALSIAPISSVDRYEPRADKERDSGSNETPPASIWDLYLAAKANDPALGRSEARVKGSRADSDQLFSTLLPHLNSSAGVKQISQSLSDYGASDATYDYTAFNYNVTAQLTLLHVPTLYSLSAAAAALGGEQAGVAMARQNLIVKFSDSYFALLKAQTDKQIALGEINRLKQVLDQSRAFLKEGTGDIISVYEAQSRLDSAGADLTKSESNLRLAEQKLSSQIGKPVSEVINYLPQHPAGPEPDSIDWWVATMEKEQPAVRQAREGLVQTSEQRKAAKAEYMPVVQASGGYDVNRGTPALPTAEIRQWFVGATISLPLYSGGETAAKVRRAVASEEERRHVFDETMEQQRENVKQAFYNLSYNISLIKALDQRKASAEIQLAAVKKGRIIGTRNAIDVLNAEQTYSLALRDCRYALYDNIIRVIQLKSAAGILAESDVSGLAEMAAPKPGIGLNLMISKAVM